MAITGLERSAARVSHLLVSIFSFSSSSPNRTLSFSARSDGCAGASPRKMAGRAYRRQSDPPPLLTRKFAGAGRRVWRRSELGRRLAQGLQAPAHEWAQPPRSPRQMVGPGIEAGTAARSPRWSFPRPWRLSTVPPHGFMTLWASAAVEQDRTMPSAIAAPIAKPGARFWTAYASSALKASATMLGGACGRCQNCRVGRAPRQRAKT